MMGSKNLTKIIADAYGNEYIACALYGTAECRALHNGHDCYGCSMLAAFLNQLHRYETQCQEDENKYADSS